MDGTWKSVSDSTTSRENVYMLSFPVTSCDALRQPCGAVGAHNPTYVKKQMWSIK
jgi:hypothetical protein